MVAGGWKIENCKLGLILIPIQKQVLLINKVNTGIFFKTYIWHPGRESLVGAMVWMWLPEFICWKLDPLEGGAWVGMFRSWMDSAILWKWVPYKGWIQLPLALSPAMEWHHKMPEPWSWPLQPLELWGNKFLFIINYQGGSILSQQNKMDKESKLANKLSLCNKGEKYITGCGIRLLEFNPLCHFLAWWL